MAPYKNQPVNTNLLQSTKFMLNFVRVPDTNFFCQSVSMPGVNMSEAIQTNPFADIYRPGDKLQYEPLTVTFLIDEYLNSWKNIHDWMRGLTKPTKFAEYTKLKKEIGIYSDANLTILNGLNNPVVRIAFFDCFPTSLSPIQFSATDDGGQTITADATFRFTYFDIVPLHTP